MNNRGDQIREVLRKHGKLACDPCEIGDDDDLYQAGLTSYTSVSVMLALEDAFDVEFPDDMLNRALFSNISRIELALSLLVQAEPSSEVAQ
jgi:acyl carrier protein